jgi:hypothetical protein
MRISKDPKQDAGNRNLTHITLLLIPLMSGEKKVQTGIIWMLLSALLSAYLLIRKNRLTVSGLCLSYSNF